MKKLYVEVKNMSAFDVWYNKYIGNIFYVTQATHWFGIWQLVDEQDNKYDLYIDKLNSEIVLLENDNKDNLILSSMIKI